MNRPRNLSEEEFTALVKRRDRDAIDAVVPRGGKPSQEARLANKVKSAPSSFRSKLEGAFSQKLAMEKMAGLLSYVAYEPLNMRLPGQRNFWKPDFLVVDDCGALTFYEVKGRNKSDERSLVKMKTAAGITPWARFVLVKRVKGAWEERIIN